MRALRKHAAAATILLATTFCAGQAAAQKNQGPPNALQGFSQNRDQPVKIQAASLEVREKDKIATFDPEKSGVGFLMMTQDAKVFPQFWDLAKGFGATGAKVSSYMHAASSGTSTSTVG